MKVFLLVLLLSKSIHTQLACPAGFTLVLSKCLMVIQNPLTHTQAEADCTYVGGTLANSHSAIENRAISDFAIQSGINKTWLGLYCFSNQNLSSCYYDDNTGTASIYNSFASGYPLVDGLHGGCVYMPTAGLSAGKWVSVKCEAESIPFVCEVPSSNNDPSCVHNYDGYCYLPSTEMSTLTAKFDDAQKICQENNGYLASIHSKRENDYVRSLFRGQDSLKYILLGGQALLPDTYSWNDGSNWSNFDNRDPLDKSVQNCLAMNIFSNIGLWSRADCVEYSYFLCKRPISGHVEPTKPADVILETSNLSDFSNCNTTFLMAPGVITSFGYMSTVPPEPAVYCTWRIVTLGAYRLRLFFTNFDTYNPVYVYDEYGKPLGAVRQTSSVISPRNIMDVTFQATGKPAYTGFSATAKPY